MSDINMSNIKSGTRNPGLPATIAALALTFVLCAAGAGQSLTLDTPSDLEHARVKAEKAWKAWEAQGHIETKLLSMPADRALSEIRRDSKLAEQYLSVRELQVKLLSDDFRRRATALESAAPPPDTDKLQKSEEQSLAALIDGDLKTANELAKLDKESDPGQREAKRQAVSKESGYYKQLAEDVRKRVEVLQSSAHSDEQYSENERALIDILNRLSATLDEQSAALAREREDWQSYHKHLEEVVLARSHGSAAAGAPGLKPDAIMDDSEPPSGAPKAK